MGSTLQQTTYIFDAQRLNLGKCAFGNRTELASNASNLAEVLNVLQHNRHRFDRLIKHLRQVFTTIKSISVRPTIEGGNVVEVRVWNIDPETERADLAVPLDESGTGVGQVIAILYVILEGNSNVIVVDEPNSFLHPAASRQLVRVMREYPQHQYIITTHSPEVLAAARPDQLLMLRLENE